MTSTAQTTLQHAEATDIARSVQANIVRPARHPDDSLPDWRLFLFFRIRTSKEFQVTRDAIAARLAAALRAGKGAVGSPEADQPFKDVWRSRTSRALGRRPAALPSPSGTSGRSQRRGREWRRAGWRKGENES